MHDVERRVFEWKLLRVSDAEAEAWLIAPCLESLDVDGHDVAHTLPNESSDSAVPAAAVEYRLVPAECETKLVEAAQAKTKLAGRQATPVLTA